MSVTEKLSSTGRVPDAIRRASAQQQRFDGEAESANADSAERQKKKQQGRRNVAGIEGNPSIMTQSGNERGRAATFILWTVAS